MDFISAVDTPFVSELNIWYHTLNCGYRTRISGETDFPCITDDRVGGGRSYVHCPGLNYDAWCEGVREGRCYVSDGFSHLMDFTANGIGGGDEGRRVAARAFRQCSGGRARRVPAPRPAESRHPVGAPVRFRSAWTPEHARVGESREVTVEVVVNGRPVASRRLVADGAVHDVAFDVAIDRSSWIALRILGSAHTNPIFVLVGGRPIRASRRSAEWCLKAVDQCWSQKSRRMGGAAREAAVVAYDHARARYRQILSECEVE